jgi:hypothetical protein
MGSAVAVRFFPLVYYLEIVDCFGVFLQQLCQLLGSQAEAVLSVVLLHELEAVVASKSSVGAHTVDFLAERLYLFCII